METNCAIGVCPQLHSVKNKKMNKNYTSWKEYVKKHIDKECNFFEKLSNVKYKRCGFR